MKKYKACKERYDQMAYRRCGKSGIDLPLISLGLWHNFGNEDDFDNAAEILRYAFDNGITHFDLANNYGPPYGSAEKNFGKIFKRDFKKYRDELIISTKAGWDMWPGPYGNFGSKKYLISSLNQSLKRMKLDYVDIFYHHRPDPHTPLEETMHALDQIVREGKALYVGVSQYNTTQTKKAAKILKSLGTPFLIHQPRYNMIDRWIEDSLIGALDSLGVGSIVFSPLEQGILTSKYINGIPKKSRAAKQGSYLDSADIKPELIEKIKKLHDIAENRAQSLAQMAIAWLLKDHRITSVLVGVSKVAQLKDNIKAITNTSFTDKELIEIDDIIGVKKTIKK